VTTVINTPSADQLTYAQISALPTDPVALLRHVQVTLPASYHNDIEYGAFTVLLGYLAQSPPPAVAQAVYQAAGMVTGVEIQDDAVDVLGRHGVGLIDQANDGNIRYEYIVDPHTGAYLGWEQYLIKDDGAVTVFQHVGTGALLETGVVDGVGRFPAK
jgi:hypothetical protein